MEKSMNDAINCGKKYVMNTYNRLPLVFTRGEGCYVWDMEGKRYLDLVAGIAVNSLGHAHPQVAEAIAQQAKVLIHCSNLYWNQQQIDLAKLLCEKSGMDKAFFANSGAEANEAAIKLARKFGKERYHIISLKKSFHGRTIGALAATGQEKYQKAFRPLPEGFSSVPSGDLHALAAEIKPETCAIMLEVIQGEGGINVPDASYLQSVQELCRKHQLLLIIDEVQTGMGRTGKGFAFEHFGLQPDIITLAKAVASGYPMGVMLAKEHAAVHFIPGDHASTFGGSPLACAAGLVSAQILLDEDFLVSVTEKGAYFQRGLKTLAAKHPNKIADVRGMGLMIGCELTIEAAPVIEKLLSNGVLVNGIGNAILRFVPPLIIEKSDIDLALEILDSALAEC